MLYVSIVVELLRARPAVAVAIAALLQAAVWTLVPTLFYAAPPGDVPTVLAVGHEFRLDANLRPPPAFWLAEIALRPAAGHITGGSLLAPASVAGAHRAES